MSPYGFATIGHAKHAWALPAAGGHFCNSLTLTGLGILALLDEGRRLLEACHAPHGYNIGINVGEAAGQTIMHLHLHLIPRYRGDVTEPRGGVRGVIPARQSY
jgi:hypothetical protein